VEEKAVVVLDTNVFVSGLLSPAGAPGLILRRFRQLDFEIATSKEQIREIQLVLKRPSLVKAIPPGTAKEALRFLLSFKKLATILNPPKLDWKFKDRGDHFLLDLVAHVDADFLVTGDKALLALKLVQSCSVVSPVEFLASL